MRASFRPRKGGGEMVTYEAMFLFATLIVAIIALVVDIMTKKK